MFGLIVEYAIDQLGSRQIQSKLETATLQEKGDFLEEINPHVLKLSMDLNAK